MGKQTQLEKAIAKIDGEIEILQHARAKLIDLQQESKVGKRSARKVKPTALLSDVTNKATA